MMPALQCYEGSVSIQNTSSKFVGLLRIPCAKVITTANMFLLRWQQSLVKTFYEVDQCSDFQMHVLWKSNMLPLNFQWQANTVTPSTV